MMTPVDFYRMLWGDDPLNGSLVMCCFDPKLPEDSGPTAVQWCGSLKESARFCEQWQDTHNVYFGLCLQGGQKRSEKSRGPEATTMTMFGLWADVDYGEHDNGKPYPPTEQDARDLIGAMPIKPTLIVHSGGGLHAYWLFKEPWVFASDDERERAKRLSKGWQELMKAEAAAKGWVIDSTFDLARVLRPVGTLNHKNGEPRDVRLLEQHERRRYLRSDLEFFVDDEPALVAAIEAAPVAAAPVDDDEVEMVVESLRNTSPKFVKLFDNGDLSDYDSDRSRGDQGLCSIVAMVNDNPQLIERVWMRSAIARQRPDQKKLKERRDYIADRTIPNAIAWAKSVKAGGVLVTNGEKNKESTVPLSMQNIVSQIHQTTDGWPRRIGNALFIPWEGGIAWIEKTAALAAYIGEVAGRPPLFYRGVGFHSMAEVFEELKRVSTAYDDVETLPHFPPLENVYYACKTPEPGDGSKLRELVSRFNGETSIDADLIAALFATAGWGGAGNRPSFGITSDAGRGSGKTTLAKMVGRLWGGRVEISPEESVESVKQRLLSPDAMTKRVAVIDNLKSMRFSSAGLEALVTADVISGKRMYVGEGQRKNSLVWITTLNGVSFATDWAQRSVIIKLRRPKYSGNWQDDVEAYIDANRDAIIADCIGFLQRKPTAELTEFTRWGNWERDVLSRLPDPLQAQRIIRDRQAEADAEGEETSGFEDHIRLQLGMAMFDADSDRVFISSKLATAWLNEVTGERYGTTKASRFIRQRIRDGGLKCVVENDCRSYGRGFVWIGKDAAADATIHIDLELRLIGGIKL